MCECTADLALLLESAANEVLETMFFTSLFGPAEVTPRDGWRAVVEFTGSRTGYLEVTAGDGTARALAGNFLGADESVPARQIGGIVGELANMLCGAVLGRLQPEGQFTIMAPVIGDAGNAEAGEPAGVKLGFDLAEGVLVVGLVVA